MMIVARQCGMLTLAACLLAGCVTRPGIVSRDTQKVPSRSQQLVRLAAAEVEIAEETWIAEGLQDLEQQVAQNPTVCRLWREYQAARSKARYIDELPDPKLGANIFLSPIETAAGSQRANLTVSQLIPWLPRLDAQAQQACFEATSLWQVYVSRQLKITADLRASWYQLYQIGKELETNRSNQELLESLLEVANAQVATGTAGQGDVLAGTLEYSQLEARAITLKRQLATTKSQLNRLIGRDIGTPIEVPSELPVRLPDWDLELLRSLAWEHQPDIEAARLRRQASRWGVEVAKLKRRPDVTVNASWFSIEDNRPTPNLVDVGQDAWAIGAVVTLPIREQKYDAMEQEAIRRHSATAASVEDVRQQYDALLVELWEQACAADETTRLYRDTIIPEAQRTLEADQAAYANGRVEFDRVVRDFRDVITLELGYHRAVSQLATSLARISQATGGAVESEAR